MLNNIHIVALHVFDGQGYLVKFDAILMRMIGSF